MLLYAFPKSTNNRGELTDYSELKFFTSVDYLFYLKIRDLLAIKFFAKKHNIQLRGCMFHKIRINICLTNKQFCKCFYK